MGFDPIELLERAYAPAPDLLSWLRALAPDILEPFDVDRIGTLSYVTRGFEHPSDMHWEPRAGSSVTAEQVVSAVSEGYGHLTPEGMRRAVLATQQPGAHSFLETFGAVVPEAVDRFDETPVDSPTVIVPTGSGVVAIVTTATRGVVAIEPEARALWRRIAIHLGAACRLSMEGLDPLGSGVEAVLDPTGRVLDATDEAATPEARETLSDAARNVERARTRAGRSDPLGALEAWQALLAGRWSLLPHVDTDGRRLVVARRNEPDSPGPPALTRRQRQVLFYASVGWSLKQIAYALGLAEGTITHHLGIALRKVGVRSRLDLVRVTGELAARVMGEPRAGTESLTDAERAVVDRVLEGWPNDRIAADRGVSVRTVANQLTSIYRKLGVSSRYELALLRARGL